MIVKDTCLRVPGLFSNGITEQKPNFSGTVLGALCKDSFIEILEIIKKKKCWIIF